MVNVIFSFNKLSAWPFLIKRPITAIVLIRDIYAGSTTRMMRENIMTDAIFDFEFICHFKGHSEQHRLWGACCNSVTVCPEINVTTSPDTVSPTKHAIAKTFQILFTSLCTI